MKGSFDRLKMALLLSLVMLGDEVFVEDIDGKLVIGKDLGSIHIFAAAEDVVIIQRLFSYASKFCDRCIVSQPGLELFGDISRHSGSIFIDGKNILLIVYHHCFKVGYRN